MYKSGEMSAPIVVAKGVDFLASKIKEIAVSNDVPIIENPPLARQLYKLVDIDQEIPETLFKAVAEVLAYIYTLRDKKYN
jgi:flagellar biosynthetic protein FlhB